MVSESPDALDPGSGTPRNTLESFPSMEGLAQAMPIAATLHVTCHLSIQQPFGGRRHYSHFTDAESEVQRG